MSHVRYDHDVFTDGGFSAGCCTVEPAIGGFSVRIDGCDRDRICMGDRVTIRSLDRDFLAH